MSGLGLAGQRWQELSCTFGEPGSGLLLLVVSDLGQRSRWLAACCCLCSRGESAFVLQPLQFTLRWCPRLLRMKRVLPFLLQGKKTFVKRMGQLLGVVSYTVVTSAGTCEYVLWSKQQNCWGEKSFYLFLCLFFFWCQCSGLQHCPVVGVNLSEGCS